MATVPAYGYSSESFAHAAAFVRNWYQSYSNQNFDRAQAIANWLTDMQRAGKSIGFAHSMLLEACNAGGCVPNGQPNAGKRVW